MSWANWSATIGGQIQREKLSYADMQAVETVARQVFAPVVNHGTYLSARCPNGHERNPASLRIHTTENYGSGYGYTICLHPACDFRGAWNNLMEDLGYDPLVPDDNRVVRIEPIPEPYVYRGHSSFHVVNWPAGKSWDRNFLDGCGVVLGSVGFEIMGAGYGRDWEGNEYAVFPCYDEDGVEYGHQDVLLSERRPGLSKTRNSPGGWIRNSAIGAQQVRNAFPDAEHLVLTEGFPDSLRLIEYGVPSIPSLGAKTWSATRSNVLAGLGFSRVFVCMNTDESGAGQAGADSTYKLLRQTGIDAVIVEQPLDVDLCRMTSRELRNYIQENFR